MVINQEDSIIVAEATSNRFQSDYWKSLQIQVNYLKMGPHKFKKHTPRKKRRDKAVKSEMYEKNREFHSALTNSMAQAMTEAVDMALEELFSQSLGYGAVISERDGGKECLTRVTIHS